MSATTTPTTRRSQRLGPATTAGLARTYQICTRCIMDTTDPEIEFDEDGVCNRCRFLEFKLQQCVDTNPEKLAAVVERIKAEGRNRRYDSVIGISGGTDSTYVAYLVKKLGLRPLAVHLDNGWNSELAVKNIENVLNKLRIDLVTHVLDWEEFRDIQIAFLKASTPDSEIPTDHAIMAALLRVARAEGIRHIISGANMRSEGIMPQRWSYGVCDWRYIKGVHKRFGTRKLRSFPHFAMTNRLMNFFVRRMRFVHILNYVDYNKTEAQAVLEKELGWRNYGGKHCESIYTRFFQSYILPRKFSIDKRRAHLSALIVSGQMTREEALEAVASDSFTEDRFREDREYVVKKLGMSDGEFEEIMQAPAKTHGDYPSYAALTLKARPILEVAKSLRILPPRIGM